MYVGTPGLCSREAAGEMMTAAAADTCLTHLLAAATDAAATSPLVECVASAADVHRRRIMSRI
jgi:hypothetical protein